ncbi:nucleoporin 88 [Epargyreus clarus]|uniref:nucleoporin 88 n=1 Tax=Epargyreus clarus TaxID=520877 RepID=UPI003C2CF10E
MDSRLYEAKLGEHKMFKDLKDSLQEDSGAKLRNLTVLKDDVFYVWNSIENCVFSVNVQHLDDHNENTPYQKLHLLSPPAFPVERMMGSECGSRLCLWGSRGVTIAELPQRWGRGGLFDSGSQTVLCKSYSLDERYLYSLSEVRRVHWHPTSFSHLLVLVSDNTIRLYNIALKAGPKLVKTFSIGRKACGSLGRTLQAGLGDAAVDFTPLPDSERLLVLSGEGDVHLMTCELEGNSVLQACLSPPLAMYPPAADNYGSESCGVAALGGGGAPVLVVLATCAATLYHCLLLPAPTDNEADGHALYVVEALELNITLNPDDMLHYSYPVHLYNCTPNTYACMHAGGVHAVTLPILGHLKDYALAAEGDTESILTAICSRPSAARHLVCTSGAGQPSPPVGFAVSPPPLPTLLILCNDGVLLTRTLEPYDLEDRLYKELQLKNPGLNQDDINNILKERQKLSFTTIIQEILAREVSQPLLNLNKSEELDPKEALELLTQATLKLRGEYMSRQQRAADAIRRKVATLAALGAQHDDWAAELRKEITEMQSKTAELKNKLSLANKIQEDMKYRCSAVVRSLRSAARTTAAERELLEELERHRARGDQLADRIKLVKEHALYKRAELKQWQEEYKKKNTALGKSHSDTISSILQQQTNQISSLIEETKLLKDQLSIV